MTDFLDTPGTPAPGQDPGPGPGPAFRPSHVVPQDGLPAWEGPDITRPTVPLDPFLPVRLLARRGEWAEILCSNGWSAWVDGRLLVAVPVPPPTAGRPLSRAEDPRPLLARAAEQLERYRRAAEDLAAGRTDRETFRRATRGLRTGLVLDGESAWLFEETAARWMYGDGSRLTTFAAVSGPGTEPAPDVRPEPPQEPPRPAGAPEPPDLPEGSEAPEGARTGAEDLTDVLAAPAGAPAPAANQGTTGEEPSGTGSRDGARGEPEDEDEPPTPAEGATLRTPTGHAPTQVVRPSDGGAGAP
ncbi:hypothetical protein [Streptomyces sp. NPDC097619]|uniref:hypothetical protein n=1 Tax=Streptomyces sp. NPDC097619 TaxID=3157228 RepID=UPI00332E8DD8